MVNKVYIEKEKCDHVRILNGTRADINQYQFAIVGPFAAVADEKIKNGAVGSFHVEEGIQVQTDTLHASQHAFDTVGNPVFWDPATKTFSDTITAGYFIVGHLLRVKDSEGVIVFEKRRYAKLVPDDLTDIQNEILRLKGEVEAITKLAGVPFIAKATLTSVAGDTPVELLDDADVPAGKKAYIHQILAAVDGAVAWGTATKVTVQDSSNVAGAEFAVGDLGANAVLTLVDATIKAPIAKGAGFTTAKGLEVVADAAGTGSDLIVTVFGYIA